MTCSSQTDDDAGPPHGGVGQGLGKHGEDGEEGEDEHGEHAASVWFHAFFLHEVFGQIAAADADYGDDEVEHEDEGLSHGVGRLVAQFGEVGRCPEEEEPPHAVGEEFAHDEGPCLAIGEALEEGNLQVVVGLFAVGGGCSLYLVGWCVGILLDVG